METIRLLNLELLLRRISLLSLIKSQYFGHFSLTVRQVSEHCSRVLFSLFQLLQLFGDSGTSSAEVAKFSRHTQKSVMK